MITPSYLPTVTERVLPRIALNFTTAVTDSRVATTRADNTATRFNSNGVIEIVNANLPRYDFDPVTLVCRGQLIEDTRTNLFLNSLIDGTNLATQSVTLAATAYTMSFYGTGSVVISGGHSATVTGTGAFPSRRTYTFTPTAGSSTFTVSGDVKFAQVEAGAFVTSFIPTAGSIIQRNFDAVNITGTNFTSWFIAGAGTLYSEASQPVIFAGSRSCASLCASANNPRITNYRQSAGGINGYAINSAGSGTAVGSGINATANGIQKTVLSYSATNLQVVSGNGSNTASIAIDMTTSLSSLNALSIGTDFINATATWNGHVRKIMWWPQQLTAAELRAFST